MGAYLGDTEIGKMFLGSTEIGQAYLGSTKVWESKQLLPYDAEIEYLESSGTQYIDTGILPDKNTSIEIDLELNQIVNSRYVLGRYASGQQFFLYIYRNTIQWGWSCSYENAIDWTTDRHLIKLYTDENFAYLNVDGSDVSSKAIQSQTSTLTTTIFCGSVEDSVSVSTGVPQKVYACKMSKNGSVVLDLIPVRVGQVGYMYDKVSGQLFGNQGTGNFILGNDITT